MAAGEADTLVVDVTGFNGMAWFDRAGNFASDSLHVVERYSLLDPEHDELRGYDRGSAQDVQRAMERST